MQIKRADQKDADQISNVLAASWKSAYRGIVHDDYLDSLQGDHWVDFLTAGLHDGNIFAMVFVDDQRIVGAAILSQEADGVANLISFYLLPEFIGQGHGHAFYDGIERELKRLGISKCRLDVMERNKTAIRFYEAHGFTDTGRTTTATLGGCEYTCKVYEKRLV